MTTTNTHAKHNPFQAIACVLVPCESERARMQRDADATAALARRVRWDKASAEGEALPSSVPLARDYTAANIAVIANRTIAPGSLRIGGGKAWLTGAGVPDAPGVPRGSAAQSLPYISKPGPMAASARDVATARATLPAPPYTPPVLEQGRRSGSEPYRFPPIAALNADGLAPRAARAVKDMNALGALADNTAIQDALRRAVDHANAELVTGRGLMVTAQQVADALAAGRIAPNVQLVAPRAMFQQLIP